jgi:hypothetical protein
MGRPGVVGPRPEARTAATVGTAAVVAHGVRRRSDRRRTGETTGTTGETTAGIVGSEPAGAKRRHKVGWPPVRTAPGFMIFHAFDSDHASALGRQRPMIVLEHVAGSSQYAAGKAMQLAVPALPYLLSPGASPDDNLRPAGAMHQEKPRMVLMSSGLRV